jgi:hypothetical protein
MGRPSDKRRSAQRRGKRQRARVKNSGSHGVRNRVTQHVAGAGTVDITYGRKKAKRVYAFLARRSEEIASLPGEYGVTSVDTILSPSVGEPVKRESE